MTNKLKNPEQYRGRRGSINIYIEEVDDEGYAFVYLRGRRDAPFWVPVTRVALIPKKRRKPKAQEACL